MALTREAVLSWHAGAWRRIPGGLRALAWMLPGLLAVACAQGVDDADELIDYATADAAPVVEEPDRPEAGVVLPPTDLPIVPVVPAPVRDAGTARDAGGSQTPSTLDAGTSSPVDSGAPKPVDSGAPKPVDAGSDSTVQPQPDAGPSGQMCAATPAYPTATSCAKCTCTKCAAQVTACYASNDSAKNTLCAAVQACAETNHCTGEGCYCGDSLLCLNPAGACKAPIESAAGSDSPLDVQRQSDDTSTAIGRAAAIGACEQMNCKSECGL